jgi:hypothetical protein
VRFNHMIPLSCWFRGWELLNAGDVEPPNAGDVEPPDA